MHDPQCLERGEDGAPTRRSGDRHRLRWCGRGLPPRTSRLPYLRARARAALREGRLPEGHTARSRRGPGSVAPALDGGKWPVGTARPERHRGRAGGRVRGRIADLRQRPSARAQARLRVGMAGGMLAGQARALLRPRGLHASGRVDRGTGISARRRSEDRNHASRGEATRPRRGVLPPPACGSFQETPRGAGTGWWAPPAHAGGLSGMWELRHRLRVSRQEHAGLELSRHRRGRLGRPGEEALRRHPHASRGRRDQATGSPSSGARVLGRLRRPALRRKTRDRRSEVGVSLRRRGELDGAAPQVQGKRSAAAPQRQARAQIFRECGRGRACVRREAAGRALLRADHHDFPALPP